MNGLIKKKGGVTLTELMIVVSILGAVFMLGSQMLIQLNRFVIMSQTRIELQRDARTTLSLITRNLRQATADSIKIDRASGQSPYSRISFTAIDGKQFIFYLSGKNLIMQTPSGSKTLTADVRYLAFGPPKTETLTIISISLTLEKEIFEGRTKALHMAAEKVMIMN
ncbi:MAG: prepilin-type N-terminal cleavage/methylation domain-containing protein [Endomicrobiia bacterium]|nr:prepilin-type N-terminal cleavage/methylation domain-containing protein [Endomicrobiia bacterium]